MYLPFPLIPCPSHLKQHDNMSNCEEAYNQYFKIILEESDLSLTAFCGTTKCGGEWEEEGKEEEEREGVSNGVGKQPQTCHSRFSWVIPIFSRPSPSKACFVVFLRETPVISMTLKLYHFTLFVCFA